MKRFATGMALILGIALSAFSQTNDMMPLAVVKLNKTETITLKNLKSRVSYVQKQYNSYGTNIELTVEQREQLLENLISEKLILQAAAKEGITIPDSYVDQEFVNTFAQQLGMNVTEAQLNDLVKQQTGKTLDEYLKENAGMNSAEYKALIKNQIIIQKYVSYKKQDELAKQLPTDEQIRNAFEMNKATFVRNDTVSLFLVMVPKDNDSVKAKAKATELRNKYIANPKSMDEIKKSADNGGVYRAGELSVQKTQQHANQLGWSYASILELFEKKEGFVSETIETSTDYQFYVVLKKYDAKMLGLSDVIQPGTTITVYDYIKSNLTQQMQSQFLSEAAIQITKELDTPDNVERKKTGEALTKILSW